MSLGVLSASQSDCRNEWPRVCAIPVRCRTTTKHTSTTPPSVVLHTLERVFCSTEALSEDLSEHRENAWASGNPRTTEQERLRANGSVTTGGRG